MQFHRIALISLFLASVGCAASAPKAVVASDTGVLARYAALTPGAQWTYERNALGQKDRATVKIVGQEGGYFVDNMGGRFRIDQHGLRDPDRYLVRLPLKAGTKWKTVVSAAAVEHARIISVGEACRVPAGRYDECLVVETRLPRDKDLALIVKWIWAKDIGLVQMQTTATSKTKGERAQMRQDLVHYRTPSKPSADPATPAEAQPPKDGEPPPFEPAHSEN